MFIFMIYAAKLRLSVMALIWIVLDYIYVCNFWKSPFYCCYNAQIFYFLFFFLGLTGTDFICAIFGKRVEFFFFFFLQNHDYQ
jgi:hypothetical protein